MTEFEQALTSTISCLVSELTKSGVIQLDALLDNIRTTAIAHRQKGNKTIADLMHRLSEYLEITAREAPLGTPEG